MRNLFNISLYIILGFIIPMLGHPALILHSQIIILMVVTCLLILSQPNFSTKDGTAHKNTDKGSLFIILILSLFTVMVSVIEWCYIHHGHTILALQSIGLIMMIIGLAFRIWSIKTLGKYFTTSVKLLPDHKIITSGPYKFLRHPSYAGAWIVFIGMGVYLGSRWGIMFALIGMGYAYHIRIQAEENALLAHFGEEYDQFRHGRWKMIFGVW